MAKLIFGCGYLGERVARRWIASGDEVYAVTRRRGRAAELRKLGIFPIVGELTKSIELPQDPAWETILFAVGYDRNSANTIQEVYVRGLENALATLPNSVRRLIYISSTGVYGQSDGEQVDEKSACKPTRTGGRACLAAERVLTTNPLGSRAIRLRLAGIYGPGRIPRMAALHNGDTLYVAGEGYLNLIHVEDAARIVLAAEQKATPPCCYVVSDGQPVMRRDFYRHLATLTSAPPPRFQEPPPDSSAAKRAGSSKRIAPERLNRDLQVPLRFPSYREGLASIVAGDEKGKT